MPQFLVVPVTIKEANAFVPSFHRHNKPTVGARLAIGASNEQLGLVGVALIGRPISRKIQNTDGHYTAEVLRVCVRPDAPRNSNSFLYGACWRVWRAMGGRKLITYTLASESGDSLRGAGWRTVSERSPNQGKGWRNRPNMDWQAVYGQLKFKWEHI